MPTNRDFSMAILVGGVELPEYHKDGVCYVESNLFTPASYTTETSELVQGEVEKQSWPVTPYQVKVTSKSNTPYSYYKVFVDGQKASQIAVHPGKSCVSEGFYDGIQITEFLFSLPRLPQNKKDRVDQSKASRVGLIEVECWNSKVTGYKKPMISQISYNQANKKDSTAVTEGKYIMSTTKMGRAVRETKKSTVEDWTLFNVRSQLTVKYVMGHALVDMGFKLRPIRIPIHRIPASVLNQPYYPQVRRKRPGPKSKTMPHLMAVLPPVPEIVLPSTSVIEIDSDSSDVIEIDAKKRKIDGELDLDAFIAEVTGESVLNVDAEDSVDKEDAKDDTKEDVKEDEKDNSGGTDGTSRVDETGAGTSKDAEAKSSKNNDEDVDAVKIEIDVDDDVADANKDGAGSREKGISEKSKDDDKAETNDNEKDTRSKEEGNDEEPEAGEDGDNAAGADAGSKDVDEDPLSEKEMQMETEDAGSQDEKGGDENTKTAKVDEDVDKNGKEDEGDKDDSCDTREGAMDAGGEEEEDGDDGDDVEQTDDNDADKESAGKGSNDMVDGGGSAGAGAGSGNNSEAGGSGDGEGRSADTSGEGGSGHDEGGSVPEVGGSGDGEGGHDGEGGSGDGVDGDNGADSGSEESNTNSNIEKLWEIMGNNTPDGETTSETATDPCNNLMEEIAKFAPLDL